MSREDSILQTLDDILLEADLLSYCPSFEKQLKIRKAEHLKDVTESDLCEIGMSKPEQRRLWKIFNKHFPPTVLGKLRKKVLQRVNSVSMKGEDRSLSRTASLRDVSLNQDQHIIPNTGIILCKQLGSGEFGSVWQGVWTVTSTQEKKQVAVKCVSPERMQTNPLDFLQEAAVLHKLTNEHIVRLYGVVLDIKKVMLVSELAPLRSLLECLREPSLLVTFPVLRLCDFAQQICDGMVYLEKNRLIHRDLAARNILVFSATKVKISDFGLSRALGVGEEYYRSNFTMSLKLPIAWCAPECVNMLKFTSASDVWAYAVTLWEMFTYGFQPWAGMNGQQIFTAVDSPQCKRLEQPDACPTEMFSLMLKCWAHEPNNRPIFQDISNLLPEIRPERVQAITECRDGQPDHLQYLNGNLITVLVKRPLAYPDGYFWKGVTEDGKTGLFLPSNSLSYLGEDCPKLPNRRECSTPSTSRSASRSGNKNKRLMISAPQGDLRHTGHIGIDGTTFGDVSFIDTEKSTIPRQIVNPLPPMEPRSVSASPKPHDAYAIVAKPSIRLQSSNSQAPLISNDYPDYTEQSINYHDSTIGGPSLLDEVFEALNTNDRPRTPENYNTSESIDRNKLMNSTGKKDSKPEAMVRPLSHSDVKMLDDMKVMANKYANKALRVEGNEIARKYLGEENEEVNDCSNAFKIRLANSFKRESLSAEKTCVTDAMNKKLEEEDSWSPAAEDAYKSLIECGKDISNMGLMTSSPTNIGHTTPSPTKSDRSDPRPIISTPEMNISKQKIFTLPKFPVNKQEEKTFLLLWRSIISKCECCYGRKPPTSLTIDCIVDEDTNFNPLKQLKEQPARIFVRPSSMRNSRTINKTPTFPPTNGISCNVESSPNKRQAPPLPPKPTPEKCVPEMGNENGNDDRLNFTCESVEKYSLLDFVLEGINKQENSENKNSVGKLVGSPEDVINL